MLPVSPACRPRARGAGFSRWISAPRQSILLATGGCPTPENGDLAVQLLKGLRLEVTGKFVRGNHCWVEDGL